VTGGVPLETVGNAVSVANDVNATTGQVLTSPVQTGPVVTGPMLIEPVVTGLVAIDLVATARSGVPSEPRRVDLKLRRHPRHRQRLLVANALRTKSENVVSGTSVVVGSGQPSEKKRAPETFLKDAPIAGSLAQSRIEKARGSLRAFSLTLASAEKRHRCSR